MRKFFLASTALLMSITLFARKIDCDIIVSPDAILPERNAAKMLSIYLGKLGYLVRVAKKATDVPVIYLGQSPEIAKMLGLKDFKSMKPDEIILKSCGDALVISGDRPRGVLYAVYTYLEDVMGFRFWNQNEYDVPPKGTRIKLSGIDLRYAPFFTRRAMYSWPLPGLPPTWKSGNPEYAVICRNNADLTLSNAKWGGIDHRAGVVHTLRRIMKGAKYFKEHPEFFSLIDGKRNPDSQLCFSNREMRKFFIERAIEYYIAEKADGSITVSHNDNGLFCRCDGCRKLLEKEKGRMSGVFLDFANEVAEALEKRFPGIIVEVSAYGPTLKAPLVTKPRKNMIVRFSSMTMNWGYPLDHEENRADLENLRAWQAAGATLGIHVYHKNEWNPFIPNANLRWQGRDFKLYRKLNVRDVFIEGVGNTNAAHMHELSTYVLRRLLWNEQLDQAALQKEFLTGFYGKNSAPYMEKYLALIHKPLESTITAKEQLRRIETLGAYKMLHWRSRHSLEELRKNPGLAVYPFIAVYMNNVYGFMSRKDLVEAVRLMDKALENAENDTFRKRLIRAAFAARFALLTDREIAAHPEEYGLTSVRLVEYVKQTIDAVPGAGISNLKASGFAGMINQIKRIHMPELPRMMPDFAQGVSREKITVFSFNDWSEMVPKRIFSVKDPEAAAGMARSMVNIGPSWAMQCRNIAGSLVPGRYRFYLRLRAEPKKGGSLVGKKGVFLNAAFYVRGAKVSYKKQMLRAKLEDFSDGKYHWKEAGVHDVDLSATSYFFCDPTNHPDVERIVVDSIMVIRVDK